MCRYIPEIDSERSTITYITINGYDGVAVLWDETGFKYTLLFWTDGFYDYSLSSDMSLKETLDIAESIQDLEGELK
jgi:hypothetical protein